MITSPHVSCTDQPDETQWQGSSEPAGFCDPLLSHHEVEQTIWRELQATPGVHFSTLTVRRVRDGVCLQGIMETEGLDGVFDVCGAVKRIAQVENVLNQLLVRDTAGPRLPR